MEREGADDHNDEDRRAYEDRFTTGGHLNFWADLENVRMGRKHR